MALAIDHCKVLIVEDDGPCAETLEQLLSTDGINIEIAHNGQQALKTLVRWQPDLVLLDVGLPDMTGYEVCRCIKKSPMYKDTIVIFLTGHNDISDEVKGLELGAIDYLTKPIQVPLLKARLKAHLVLNQKTT